MARPDADSLELRAHAGGTVLRLRVKPKAKADALIGVHGGALKLSVRAAPEGGNANLAVRRLLAEHLGLALNSVEIETGPTSPDKSVLLRGLAPEEARRAIRDALGRT
jgi:uncharacterized protein